MHKLKNKHTGEVITTPYMAEVEECLNSGDYEMYKSENEIAIEETKARSHKENERKLCDLREFLARSNLRVIGCSAVDTAIKLIEDAYIAKDKPVYTEEMHERGELPPVGSFVEKTTGKERFDHDVFAETYDDCCIPYGWDMGANLEVVAHTEISGSILPVVKHDDLVSAIILSEIKPIPTIEDELVEFVFQNNGIRSRDCGKRSAKDVVRVLLEKYNITPRERADD